MKNISIRKGKPEDADHFSELTLLTSPRMMPVLFGPKVKILMRKLFTHRRHYYSYDRSFFVEVDGKIAGMAQLHKLSPRRRERIRFNLLLLKYLNWRLPARVPGLLKSERMIKLIAGDDFYLSSIAVYPQFQSLGIGAKLMQFIEEEAKSIGRKRIVLRADARNVRAISFYERCGYKIEEKATTVKLNNNIFESFKIAKLIPS